MGPIQVAIVVSGYATAGGQEMSRRMYKDLFETVQLWDILTDRVTDEQVYHGSPAGDPMTILAIYSQPAFSKLVRKYTGKLLERADDNDPTQLIHAECRTGHHRAATFGLTMVDVLNSIEDGEGNRRFNAQLFPLLNYTKPSAICNQIDSAVQWTQRSNPHIMPGGADRDRKSLFGYAACAQREAAEKHFGEIWDHVDAINDIARQTAERRVRSRSPRRRPSIRYGASASSSDRPHRPVQLPLHVPPPADASTDELPPWANISVESDMAASWKDVLDDYGVDSASQHGLYALAQSSSWGRQAAFGVMFKLWKRAYDGDRLQNPSAFVWKAVRNKWDECSSL